MNSPPISTQPVADSENVLRDKFAESVAGQSELMDKLGQQMLTLELAIPGLYAAVLQLVYGKDATATVDRWLFLAFGCWFLALALTLWGLFPRQWQVDPTMLKQDPAAGAPALSLEEFFARSARRKYWRFLPAAALFWLGVLGATFSIF